MQEVSGEMLNQQGAGDGADESQKYGWPEFTQGKVSLVGEIKGCGKCAETTL